MDNLSTRIIFFVARQFQLYCSRWYLDTWRILYWYRNPFQIYERYVWPNTVLHHITLTGKENLCFVSQIIYGKCNSNIWYDHGHCHWRRKKKFWKRSKLYTKSRSYMFDHWQETTKKSMAFNNFIDSWIELPLYRDTTTIHTIVLCTQLRPPNFLGIVHPLTARISIILFRH